MLVLVLWVCRSCIHFLQQQHQQQHAAKLDSGQKWVQQHQTLIVTLVLLRQRKQRLGIAASCS
jgi:hypothetical protein